MLNLLFLLYLRLSLNFNLWIFIVFIIIFITNQFFFIIIYFLSFSSWLKILSLSLMSPFWLSHFIFFWGLKFFLFRKFNYIKSNSFLCLFLYFIWNFLILNFSWCLLCIINNWLDLTSRKSFFSFIFHLLILLFYFLFLNNDCCLLYSLFNNLFNFFFDNFRLWKNNIFVCFFKSRGAYFLGSTSIIRF